MKHLFIFLSLIPFICSAQTGTPKKFSQIPVYATPAVSSTDYFIGTHDNGDGTYTDYRYQPSTSIVDTILGVTYTALDSGLLTRMNTLTIVDNTSGSGTAGANTFIRINHGGGISTITLPLHPLDGTLVGGKAINIYLFARFVCNTGQHFNYVPGPFADTLSVVNQTALYQYRAADSTWTVMCNYLPYIAPVTQNLHQTLSVGDSSSHAIYLSPNLNRTFYKGSGGGASVWIGTGANGAGWIGLEDTTGTAGTFSQNGIALNCSLPLNASEIHVYSGLFNSSRPLSKEVAIALHTDTTGNIYLNLNGRVAGSSLQFDTAHILKSNINFPYYTQTISWNTATANRLDTIPDESGIFAFTKDIPTYLIPRDSLGTTFSTIAYNNDRYDMGTITAQATGITIANFSGTAHEGQWFEIIIKASGGAQTISYGTNFLGTGSVALPSSTGATGIILNFQYTGAFTKWILQSVNLF